MSAVDSRRETARSRPQAEAIAIAVAALLAGSYLLAAAASVAAAPWFKWNEVRLACVAGLLDGYSLYATREAGPILSWIYPPIAALPYLPAALLAEPVRVVLAGSVIAALCTIGPAAWLHFSRVERAEFGVALCSVAFSTFGLFTTTVLALEYSSYSSHVDAPTLGAAALACGVLIRWLDGDAAHRGSSGASGPRDANAWRAPGTFTAAAVLAALAIACKQTLLPMLIVMLLWIVFEHGWRCAVVFGTIALAALAVLIVASGAWLGYEGLWLNAVEVPRRHPLSFRGMYWVANALVPALLCFAILGVAWRRGLRAASTHQRRRLLLVAVGLSLIPSAFLSRAKHGGDVNSFSLFLYFFGLAASLELKRVLAPLFSYRRTTSRAVRLATLVALAVLATHALASAYRDAAATFLGPAPSPIAHALAIEREHGNAVYFPHHPLVMLRIDGRLYHDPRAVKDWKLAGISPTLERLSQDLPTDRQTVAMRDFESPPSYLGALSPIEPLSEPAYDLRYYTRP
jgi:hypothetical protein